MSGRWIRQRRPNEASAFLAELERVGGAQAPCLREVQEAAGLLGHEEFEHAGRDKTFAPVLFQNCFRRRLRLPLMLSNRRCEGCGALLDSLGDHKAACSVYGRLRRRAKPIELAWSAFFAEAGAVVSDQVLLRDTNIEGITAGDSQESDFIA